LKPEAIDRTKNVRILYFKPLDYNY